MSRGLGWVPDGPSFADFALRSSPSLAAYVPEEHSLEPLFPAVLDQGSAGSCVAHAVVAAERAVRARDAAPSAEVPIRNRLVIYYLARRLDNMQGFDEGTRIRNAMRAITKMGAALESAWPYKPERVKDEPPLNVLRLGFDSRNGTYRRIFATGWERVDEVKLAIASGFPVVFGTDVDENFVDGRFAAAYPLSAPVKNIAGGHAMAIMGYRGDHFRVRNSWGISWGDRGDFWMHSSWLAHPMTRDLWALESAR